MELQKLTFEISDGVKTEKVHFKNRFGIELTGYLYDGGHDHNMIPWDTVNNFFAYNLK